MIASTLNLIPNVYYFDDGGILSPWYRSRFAWKDNQFNCVYQFVHWKKALFAGNSDLAEAIKKTINREGLREYANAIQFSAIDTHKAEEWNRKKEPKILYEANLLRFIQNEEGKRFLLQTNQKPLVYASPNMSWWSIGIGLDHPDIGDHKKWPGPNGLGKILMQLRKEFILSNKVF